MLIKGITDEDFINYKKKSMVIAFPYCSFKCDKECGRAVCQNSPLVKEPNINISCQKLIERYLNNGITEAIVCQGLDPLDSFDELYEFILLLRDEYHCNDDVVIYTGYNKEEVLDYIEKLSLCINVVIKYGRYIPDQTPHYDEVLGVNLASDNQYAERL